MRGARALARATAAAWIVIILLGGTPRAAEAAAWANVGGELGLGTTWVTSAPSIAWSGTEPWVAFTVPSATPRALEVRRWTGAAWVQVGTNLATDTNLSPTSPTLRFAGTTPYVSFKEGDEVYVKYWNGSAWVQLGTGLRVNTLYKAAFPRMTIIGGVPYVSFREGDTNVKYQRYVKYWNGAAWTLLGGSLNANTADDSYEESDITSDGSAPIVAMIENVAANKALVVKRWNGSSWATLGGVVELDPAKTPTFPTLAHDGVQPIVAFSEPTGYGSVSQTYVRRWDGSAWQTLGGTLNMNTAKNTGWGGEFDMVMYGGQPHIVFSEGIDCWCGEASYLYVKKWNGATWDLVGSRRFNRSAADAYIASLAAGTDLYVSWEEGLGNGGTRVYVKRLDPTLESAILRPVADRTAPTNLTRSVWDGSACVPSTTGLFAAIDEDLEATNNAACGAGVDGDLLDGVANAATVAQSYELTDAPANFSVGRAVRFEVNAWKVGGKTYTLTGELRKSDGTLLATTSRTLSSQNYSNTMVTVDGLALSAADVSGMYASVNIAVSGGGSGTTAYLSTVDVELIYEPVTGPNAAPNAVTGLQQYRNDGTTQVASGATVADGVSSNVVLRFTVSDPDANQTLTPWVEYRPGATAFSGTCGAAAAGAVVSGAPIATTTAGATYTATVNITGLTAGQSYRWRACVRDQGSQSSAWLAKGASPDFIVAPGMAPTVSTLVSPTANMWVTSTTPTLTATFQDPDAGNTGEVGFETCATNAPDPWSTNCASGYRSGTSSAGIAIGGSGGWAPNTALPEYVTLHWRARGIDATGYVGPWSGTETFRIDASAPSKPTGVAPVTRGLGAVRIAWAASTDAGVGGVTYDVMWSTDGLNWQNGCMGTALTECQQGGLGGQELVHFRARACDSLGNCSAWSNVSESTGTGHYLRTTTPTYYSTLLTDAANRITSTATGGVQATTNIDFRSTTGWFVARPGVSNASRQSIAEPADTPWPQSAPITGTGWVVDSYRGFSIDDGPIQVVVETNSTASTAVAYLQARAWRVTTDGAGAITASAFLGKATTPTDVADGLSGMQRTLDITSPGIAQPVSLGANESIYVEVWLNVTSGAGSAGITLNTDDDSSYVVLPPAGLPPDVPTLQAPANGSIAPLSPLVSATYSHPSASDGYLEFQVATDGTFTTIVETGASATTASGSTGAYAIGVSLPEGTTYSWRARARDVFGRASAWSTTWQFTTDRRPTTPVNSFPADAGTAPLTPTFISSAFADPDPGALHTASQWQLRTSTGSYAFAVADSGTTSSSLGSWTSPTSLTSGNEYWWRVRHRDEFGVWSDWSTETRFTATAGAPPNGAPAAPSALQQYRSDGVTVIASGGWNDSGTVRFSMTASDPDASAILTAWVEVTSGAFSATCGVASATTFGGAAVTTGAAAAPVTLTVTASGLSTDVSYRWRACVVDQHGAVSAWTASGATPDFRIDAVDPSVSLVSPLDGVADPDTTPTLTATYTDPATGTAGQVDFRIGTSPTCGVSVLQSGSSAAALASGANGTWTAAVLASGTYYWCAQAVDGAGNRSAWSAARELVIGAPGITIATDNAAVAIVPTVLTPGMDGHATSTVTVTTNSSTGFSLTATDASDATCMTQGGATTSDWTGLPAAPSPWATGTSGYCGLSVISAAGGKDTTRWGVGSTAGDYDNLKYVGLRSSTQTLLYQRAAFDAAPAAVVSSYRVNFGAGALAGSWSTTVTYTATVNP